MKINEALKKIDNGEFNPVFEMLYGSGESVLEAQKERYKNAILTFLQKFPTRDDIKIYSAPGRTEIGGNHTDHQHGNVLAAAVNLDIVAVAAFHDEKTIRVKSKGYEVFTLSTEDLSPKKEEKGSSAIVRGIAASFAKLGVEIGGFDMYTTSDVLSGSGISSSAAFETMIGTVIDSYYNENKAGPVTIAKIGQYAENIYFGKKSGLMDQMVSATGGLVAIDFHNTDDPKISSFQFDFEKAGYCICITDTKGSHANLTDDYVAVPLEMESVAHHFGKNYLRDVDEADFYQAIPALRKTCNDRAILRSVHFFEENRRAVKEASALMDSDIDRFLELVNESGNSSAALLQNLYSASQPTKQEIPFAIMMSKRFLCGKGAVRVHGGGFAGTIQAFVPVDLADEYAKEMNSIFGKNSCYKLRIRPVGGIEITSESKV